MTLNNPLSAPQLANSSLQTYLTFCFMAVSTSIILHLPLHLKAMGIIHSGHSRCHFLPSFCSLKGRLPPCLAHLSPATLATSFDPAGLWKHEWVWEKRANLNEERLISQLLASGPRKADR